MCVVSFALHKMTHWLIMVSNSEYDIKIILTMARLEGVVLLSFFGIRRVESLQFETASMVWIAVEARSMTHDLTANGIRVSIFSHTHMFQHCKYSRT